LSSDARSIADRLVGLRLPSVSLATAEQADLDLAQHASLYPLGVYFYPGRIGPGEFGEHVLLADGMQHRAFRDHQIALDARGYRALGVSSEPQEAQWTSSVVEGLPHTLLSDPELLIAQALKLPTHTLDGVDCYERLTLVVAGGVIAKAFYPVSSPHRNPEQVIAWMKVQGI
jgi:peroxiredoxin